MKSLRWGLLLSLLCGMFVLTGCQGKWISRSEMDKYKGLERLNTDQATMISALTADKERLTEENAHLRAELATTGELLDTQKRLVSELQGRVQTGVTSGELEGGDIIVGQGPRGVFLRMESDVLFDPGQASLKPEGEKILQKAADIVRDQPNKLQICGFTDSDPIRQSGWKSNFDLSGARALTVLETLKKNGIEPDRMHFSGYGEYALIMKGGKEDKKRSRRAEIVLLNDEPLPEDEAPVAPSKRVVVPK